MKDRPPAHLLLVTDGNSEDRDLFVSYEPRDEESSKCGIEQRVFSVASSIITILFSDVSNSWSMHEEMAAS